MWSRSGSLQIGAFVCGLVLTLFLGYWAVQRNDVEEDLRFESDASTAARRLEMRLVGYSEMLRGLQALFDASPEVTRERFHNYVQALDLPRRHPGVQSISYVRYQPNVPGAAARALTRDEHDRPREMTIDAAGASGRFILEYLERAQAETPRLAFNPLNDAARREQVALAVASGEPTASARLSRAVDRN